MEVIKKRYAEVWQENETSIVIKMLDQSMKNRDQEKIHELKRSLLDLERKSENAPSDDEWSNSSPTCKSDCFPSRSKSFTTSHLSGSTSETLAEMRASFSHREEEYLEKAMRQNTKQYDSQVNVMIIGNSVTGKTSLMNAMLGIKSSSQTKPTIGYAILS